MIIKILFQKLFTGSFDDAHLICHVNLNLFTTQLFSYEKTNPGSGASANCGQVYFMDFPDYAPRQFGSRFQAALP